MYCRNPTREASIKISVYEILEFLRGKVLVRRIEVQGNNFCYGRNFETDLRYMLTWPVVKEFKEMSRDRRIESATITGNMLFNNGEIFNLEIDGKRMKVCNAEDTLFFDLERYAMERGIGIKRYHKELS